MLRDLHRDAKLLMAARGIRAFAFSYLNVVFAIYLDRLGYSTVIIGVIFSVAYLSGAVLTALWGYLSDRFGRRNILMLLGRPDDRLQRSSWFIFTDLFFILLAVIIANVGAGGSGGGGSGGGPFNPAEEALAGGEMPARNRNQIFAVNSFVGSVMGSVGALASGLPQFLQERWGWDRVASYKPLFILTIVFSVALLFVYRAIRRAAPAAASRKENVQEHRRFRHQDVRRWRSSTTSAPAWRARWSPTGSFSASGSSSSPSASSFLSPTFLPRCRF